jgi:putative photosynthetic complex assembly protein 2
LGHRAIEDWIMGATAIAVAFVVFVWWFSTGAVLLLVGLASRHATALKLATLATYGAALSGVAVASRSADDAGAYCAFTCAILLWGAVEMSLLAGWITGPRPEACPRDCTGAGRVGYALQAIAYHELMLIATAGLVFAVTAGAPNRLSWWVFAALLLLRLSAKLNLFLGVRTLNDELLPQQVRFMRSYFARKQVNRLFPFSMALAVAATILVAAGAAAAETSFDQVAASLLAALIALGALEHGFMVLPIPVVNLWRWSTPSAPLAAAGPALAVLSGGLSAGERPMQVDAVVVSARQRLEDQFRQAYRERQAALAEAGVMQTSRVGTPGPINSNRTEGMRS